MSDKTNFLYDILNYPSIFNIIRTILDGGQVNYIRKIISQYNITSILDIGCGCGFFSKIAMNRYLGIDYNSNFISYSNRKFGDKNKRFIVMDATNLSITENFDTAILINFIHHFSDSEVIKILENARKNVENYIIIHDLTPQKNPISRFFYKIDRGNFIRTLPHQLNLIKESNLKVEKILYHRTFPGIYLHDTIICKNQ